VAALDCTQENGPLSGPLFYCRLANLLGESANRRSFVVSYIEYGIKLRDLKQVVDFLGQIQQLQFAALVPDARKRADKLPDPRAVNVSYVAEIQKYLLVALAHHVANGVTQDHAAFT
jgi:hypothetical protein